jgi:hypothetical protein
MAENAPERASNQYVPVVRGSAKAPQLRRPGLRTQQECRGSHYKTLPGDRNVRSKVEFRKFICGVDKQPLAVLVGPGTDIAQRRGDFRPLRGSGQVEDLALGRC